MYILKIEEKFEAAHRLDNYDGKCSRLHGHNWRVQATVTGSELNHLGILVDFKDVKRDLNTVLNEFDHRYLNELPPFNDGTNPTAENLARVIFKKLASSGLFGDKAKLAAVTVWEGETSCITYAPEGEIPT